MVRARAALKKIDGLIRYDIDPDQKILVITFDDRVTTHARIMEQLTAQGYQIEGQPIGSKKEPCP